MPKTSHTQKNDRNGENSRIAELIRWEIGTIRRLKSAKDGQVCNIACRACDAALDIYTQGTGSGELPPAGKDLTEMLYDASPAKQRSAIALIKSIADTHVTRVTSQVPHLLRLLNNKKAHPTTKRICVVTLARIFTLTQGNAELTRTVTTPSLPSFISTCLNLIASKSRPTSRAHQRTRQVVLESILESFRMLLPLYPTTFRPYESQVRDLVCSLLASTPSSTHSPESGDLVISPSPLVVRSAASVYALLHFTVSKNEQSRKWNSDVRHVISEAHSVANEILRPFVEEWQSSAGYPIPAPSSGEGEPAQQEGSKSVGLLKWSGIYAGCERMNELLRLLKVLIATGTAGSVSFPVDTVQDLLRRLYLATIPPRGNRDNGLRINEAVGRDERVALCSKLPSIHVAALKVIEVLFERFGASCPGFANDIVNYVLHAFRTERMYQSVQKHYYRAVGYYLRLYGIGLGRDRAQDLADLIQACCEDLTPLKHRIPTQNASFNASHNESHLSINNLNDDIEAREPALSLMEAYLSKVPSEHNSSSIRSQLLRTAILSGDERVMLASTVNPSPALTQGVTHASSIVPFLARAYKTSVTTEVLLRPRLPPLTAASSTIADMAEIIDEDTVEVSQGDDSEEEDSHSAKPSELFSVPSFDERNSLPANRSGSANADKNFATMTDMQPENSQPAEKDDTRSRAPDAVDSPLFTGEPKGPVKRQKSPEEVLKDLNEETKDIKDIKRVRLESPQGDEVMAEADLVDASEEDKLDGDDFEIPPLTMDPDTDEEDESDV